MDNIDLFNHYAIRVIGTLYENFPCYLAINIDAVAEPLLDMPPKPIETTFMDRGVYVGPDLSWAIGQEQIDAELKKFNWTQTIKGVEALLGRELTGSELADLKSGEGRPLSENEKAALKKWENECAAWRNNRSSTEHERYILIETTKYLVHEGLIRHHQLPTRLSYSGEPIDVLIDQHFGALKFALTAQGCSRMLRKDPLSRQSQPIAKRVLAYIGNKGADVATGSASGVITSVLFGV